MVTIRFEVRGDCAMACYFLVANWHGKEPAPTFDTRSNPITLSFLVNGKRAADEIRQVLSQGEGLGGAMAKSSIAMRALLDLKLQGISLPDAGPSASSGAAG